MQRTQKKILQDVCRLVSLWFRRNRDRSKFCSLVFQCLTHKCFNNENPEIQKYTKNGNTNKDWNISMIKILSIYLEAKKIPPQVWKNPLWTWLLFIFLNELKYQSCFINCDLGPSFTLVKAIRSCIDPVFNRNLGIFKILENEVAIHLTL